MHKNLSIFIFPFPVDLALNIYKNEGESRDVGARSKQTRMVLEIIELQGKFLYGNDVALKMM